MFETPSKAVPTVQAIAAQVATHYGVEIRELLGQRRPSGPLLRARQVAAYLAAELTAKSLPEIGRALDRDHTSILHSRRRVADQLKIDRELRRDIEAIVGVLEARPADELAAFVGALETLTTDQLVAVLRVEVQRLGGTWWTDLGEGARGLVAVHLHRVFASGVTVADACLAWRGQARRLLATLTTIHMEEQP